MILEPQKRISEKALKVWRITGTINSAFIWILAAGILFLVHYFSWPGWIAATMVILGILCTYLLIYLFPSFRWKRWKYEVRAEEIELQHGIFFRVRTLIPMVRVQHVDTTQGPILRKYHLSSVTIHTAATSHEISALEEEEAEELRSFISKLARVAEEDV